MAGPNISKSSAHLQVRIVKNCSLKKTILERCVWLGGLMLEEWKLCIILRDTSSTLVPQFITLWTKNTTVCSALLRFHPAQLVSKSSIFSVYRNSDQVKNARRSTNFNQRQNLVQVESWCVHFALRAGHSSLYCLIYSAGCERFREGHHYKLAWLRRRNQQPRQWDWNYRHYQDWDCGKIFCYYSESIYQSFVIVCITAI